VFLFGGLLATAVAPIAFAQEPPPPLPPPPPSIQKDVVIEYVPAESSSASPSAPSRPAPDQPPPAPAQKEDDGQKARTSFRAEGGFQYSQLFGVPRTGARLRFGAGAQNDSFAHYATISVLYGGTENDLRTWDFRLGYTGDFLRVSILRLGLDAEMGYLFIHRASADERMFALGAGAGAHAGFDIVAFGPHDDHAVTAQARFDASLHFGGAFVWGPAVLIGFRY
jgi:hypothetical protein